MGAVRLSRVAARDLERLAAPVRRKADEVLAQLERGELPGKKLLGALEGLRSARVARTHRLIYKVVDGEAFVVAIPLRRDAYR